MKFFKLSDYNKGLLASLTLHGVLIFALFFYSEPLKSAPAAQQQALSISLSAFTSVQEAPKQAQTPPARAPKKVVEKLPEKKICKTKPKQHKKHAKKEHKKHKKYKKEAPRKEYVKKEQVQKETPKPEAKIAKTEPLPEPIKEIAKEPTETLAKAEPIQEQTQETQETKEQKSEPEALAKAAPAESQKKSEPSAASLEQEFIATNFEVIRAMVLENLKYPRLAKRMQQTGIVVLLLVINEQGKLVNISLENSSGYKLLDKSALKAAQYLSEMSLPVPKSTSKILLPVAFALN